jgi:hypothetical protein
MKDFIFLSFFLFFANTHAVSQIPEMSLKNKTVCPGGTFFMSVDAKHINGVAAMTIFLEYDTVHLKLDSVANLHPDFSNLRSNVIMGETPINTIAFSWYDINGVSFDSTKIFDLCFRHKTGTSTVEFSEQCEISSMDLNPVFIQYQNATVTPAVMINEQTRDTSVYFPESACFFIDALGAEEYRWQMSTDKGNSFVDLEDDHIFQGTLTDTLWINHTTREMDSSQFRCRLTRQGCAVYSAQAQLSIVLPPYSEFDVYFTPGWNSFSSHLHPGYAAIDSVFSEFMTSVIFISDGEQIFYPGANIITLNQFDSKKGYQIKLSEETAFSFTGYEMTDKSVALYEGWNLMPCLYKEITNIQDMESTFLDHLILIKDAVGINVYWPEKNINALQHLEPGKSYLVKMSANTTLYYSD